MKNSSWLNIWAVVTFLSGATEAILFGTGYALVMCAVLTAGAAICKSVEKQKA